jgi:glycosyltransferase involved in cell wall biosynthesis
LRAPQISIVIPLYNESETFYFLVQRLEAVMRSTDLAIEIVMIDDGSRDDTALKIKQLAFMDDRFHGVFLSRNYGHQLALTAGIAAAKGTEAIFVIDGDLQDPPELLMDFYKLLNEGNDVIYAIRKKRKEGVVKKSAYFLFYRILKSISYIDIPMDSGDFAMISRRVVDILNKMPEESRYLRGMRSWIGFKQVGFEYERDERKAGESKYSFGQLFKLAYNGIFNFSEFPIKFMTFMGIGTILISLLYFITVVIKKVFFTQVIEGFTSLLFVIILFSGVQLLALGVIGEYVLRIFFQSKNRPLYIIKEEIINKEFIK